MLVLTVILAFLGVLTGAFGVAGMGTSRKSLQQWGLALIVASLVAAYFYQGWGGVAVTAVAEFIVFSVLANSINQRHHGLDFDRQPRMMSAEQFIAMGAKHQKRSKGKK